MSLIELLITRWIDDSRTEKMSYGTNLDVAMEFSIFYTIWARITACICLRVRNDRIAC